MALQMLVQLAQKNTAAVSYFAMGTVFSFGVGCKISQNTKNAYGKDYFKNNMESRGLVFFLFCSGRIWLANFFLVSSSNIRSPCLNHKTIIN